MLLCKFGVPQYEPAPLQSKYTKVLSSGGGCFIYLELVFQDGLCTVEIENLPTFMGLKYADLSVIQSMKTK